MGNMIIPDENPNCRHQDGDRQPGQAEMEVVKATVCPHGMRFIHPEGLRTLLEFDMTLTIHFKHY